MSAFDPLAVKIIRASDRRWNWDETRSRGVTGLDTIPVYVWWRAHAKCAAVNEPPEPTANKGREADAEKPAIAGSIGTVRAQEYVSRRFSISVA